MTKNLGMQSRVAPVALVCLLVWAAGCQPVEETGDPDVVEDAEMDAQEIDGGTDVADTRDVGDARDTSMMPDTRWPSVDAEACGQYAARGDYAVGVTEIEVDGKAVEVWYPAANGATDGEERATYDIRNWLPDDQQGKIPDEKAPLFEMNAYRDVAASGEGPFPLVLFSHGLAGYRMQSTFLTDHLASWGYVVASADHPGRNLAAVLGGGLSGSDAAPETMKSVRTEIEQRAQSGSGLLDGLVEPGRFAVTGHSAGAGSAVTFAKSEEVAAMVGYAGGPSSSSVDTKGDAFLMTGTRDEIVPPSEVESGWQALTGSKRLLNVQDAGHLAFADICLIGRDRGGILEIADRNGVNVPQFIKDLGSDGCRDDDLPPELAWPLINHFTVAQLRLSFGQDANPVDLGDETVGCFGGLVADYRTE